MAIDTTVAILNAGGQTFTLETGPFDFRGATVQRVTDSEGRYAMKYYQPAQRTEFGKYAFIVRATIAMAFVEPNDADILIRKVGGCCGGRTRLYHYANESDVKRWVNNGGR
jgi:hypothetical protein